MLSQLSGGHRAGSERAPQLGGIAATLAMAGMAADARPGPQSRTDSGRAPM
jgi:hypothetical protein